MSPDAREESSLPTFRAALPPELEGVDLESPSVHVEPVPFDTWAADLDDRLEALEGE